MDFVYLRALGQILKMSYHFIPKLSTVVQSVSVSVKASGDWSERNRFRILSRLISAHFLPLRPERKLK